MKNIHQSFCLFIFMLEEDNGVEYDLNLLRKG